MIGTLFDGVGRPPRKLITKKREIFCVMIFFVVIVVEDFGLNLY